MHKVMNLPMEVDGFAWHFLRKLSLKLAWSALAFSYDVFIILALSLFLAIHRYSVSRFVVALVDGCTPCGGAPQSTHFPLTFFPFWGVQSIDDHISST